MTRRTQIMDESAVRRALMRITHEILEHNEDIENVCLLGVKRRGIPLASILQENIEKVEGKSVPLGELDITVHRDDMTDEEKAAAKGECRFPCDIRDKTVIIVDDVLYTGRTARAAIESVFAVGRPKAIQLAVLVDRGHRELPLRPDYVGKNVPTARSEKISVLVDEYDGETGAYILS